MSGREKRAKRRKADERRFVEVAQRPSIGVETSTGRPWVGVDQQVGHGSADALFALTDEQYVQALVDGALAWGFEGECWRGEHEDLRLFSPAGGAWRPERWHPLRTRMLPPRFAGELWWHVDALGDAEDGERLAVSRALAAGTALVEADAEGVERMTFRLVGEGAYPRPAALIAGLDAGGGRERARAVLGDPVAADAEADVGVHAVEGDRVRLRYVAGGLAEVVLERPAPRPLPHGGVRAFLAALGEPEQGEAFRAVARLAGGTSRRWAFSSGAGRRLIVFDGGVEVQVEDARVLSARIRLRPSRDGAAYRHADGLLPGTAWPPSRADVHRALGEPAASSGGVDLHRFGERDLLVEYGLGPASETPRELTAVLHGASVSHGVYRWRSGEFTLFLDVLGREESHPLVEHVRGLAGARLRLRNGRVAEVEIGGRGYQSERFAAFVDGMPAEPTREEIPLPQPSYVAERDDVHEFEQGWIRVHAADGTRVARISVSREPPDDPDLRRWLARYER